MVLKQYTLSSFGETKRLLSIGDIYDQLLFFEKLYVFNNDGKRVGRFSIKVDLSEIQSCKMLLVHISNRGILDGRLSESVVTGVLAMNMKTAEEIRHELSQMSEEKHIRRFYLLRERTKYYYSVTESVGEIENKRHGTIPFAKTSGLVGEAGNVILMRALVVRGYEGIVSVKTILSNGKRCWNYYIRGREGGSGCWRRMHLWYSLMSVRMEREARHRLFHIGKGLYKYQITKSAERVVNGQKMDVMIVYRSVTDHASCNVTSTCTFTKAGQLLNVFWSNSEFFLHVDPDLEIYEHMPMSKPIPLHRHWNRDKQIFSFYLDKKVEVDAMVRCYRCRKDILKRLLGDWLQFALLTRPSDILCSAIEYFTSFGNKTVCQCEKQEKQKNC